MKKLLVMSLLFLVGCSKFGGESQAEKALRNFIEARFEKNLTKDQMMMFVDGEIAEEIKKMASEEFDFFTKLEGFKKTDFEVLTRNCERKKCVIVYKLDYDEFKQTEKRFSTQVKKVATIVRDTEGFWKITKVDNVKTYLKSHEELNINN